MAHDLSPVFNRINAGQAHKEHPSIARIRNGRNWADAYPEETLQSLIERTAMAIDTWESDRRITHSHSLTNMYPYGVLDILVALGFVYGDPEPQDSLQALQWAKDQMQDAQTRAIWARIARESEDDSNGYCMDCDKYCFMYGVVGADGRPWQVCETCRKRYTRLAFPPSHEFGDIVPGPTPRGTFGDILRGFSPRCQITCKTVDLYGGPTVGELLAGPNAEEELLLSTVPDSSFYCAGYHSYTVGDDVFTIRATVNQKNY